VIVAVSASARAGHRARATTTSSGIERARTRADESRHSAAFRDAQAGEDARRR